jgi:hypothetical protein
LHEAAADDSKNCLNFAGAAFVAYALDVTQLEVCWYCQLAIDVMLKEGTG